MNISFYYQKSKLSKTSKSTALTGQAVPGQVSIHRDGPIFPWP